MRHSTQDNDIRDMILDAVGRLLERYGYRKMTVDDIAHEAGIGKGTIYLYFPSKEEMALSWIDRANQAMQERLRQIADSDLPPDERVRRMLVTRVMIPFDGTQRFALSLDDLFAAVRPAFFARRVAYLEGEAGILAQVLADGRDRGMFGFEDADAVAHALLLATNSLLPYSLSTNQLGRREEIEAKALGIANLLLNGILHRSKPGDTSG